MSRTRRFLDGAALSYANQILTMMVGIWLTPFLLRHLGQNDFGLWMIELKALGYLSLLDFGVLALLPREVAYAKGRIANGASRETLRTLIEETTVVILSQAPLLALASAIAWYTLPLRGETIRNSVALVLVVFTLQFPLRVLYATLEGLQELRFLGGLQMAAWACGILVNALLVLRGSGLYGLAVGWALTQAIIAAGASWYLFRYYPEYFPKRLRLLSWREYGKHVGAGLWVSVGQIATLLRTSDLLLVGKFLGPAAVVPFSCTQKLTAIGSNQPLVIMQMAQPALSELRVHGDRKHLADVVSSLTQAMLLLSGAVTVVIIAVNRSFVSVWVGSSQYLGLVMTIAMVAEMMFRHWNVTTVYSLFSFGRQRHISIVSVTEAALSVVFSAALIFWMGSLGAVLGSIAAVLLVSLPWNLHVLSRELDCSILDLLAPLRNWALLFLPTAAALGLVGEFLLPRNYFLIGIVALFACAAYALTQWGVVKDSHWIGYLPLTRLKRKFVVRAPQPVA